MPVMVLIADDDEGFRRIARRAIEGAVAVVGEATCDEEAIRMAKELRPDVVLMNVNLPLAGGVETTRRLKGERPDAKVIMTTALDEEAYLAATGKSGADAFLAKRNVKVEALSVLRTVAGNLFRRWDGRERRKRVLALPYARDRRERRRPTTWNGTERRHWDGRERRAHALGRPYAWDGQNRRGRGSVEPSAWSGRERRNPSTWDGNERRKQQTAP